MLQKFSVEGIGTGEKVVSDSSPPWTLDLKTETSKSTPPTAKMDNSQMNDPHVHVQVC